MFVKGKDFVMGRVFVIAGGNNTPDGFGKLHVSMKLRVIFTTGDPGL